LTAFIVGVTGAIHRCHYDVNHPHQASSLYKSQPVV
jgi:hypothetical protein